jgi:hypothetical protein
VYVSNIILNKYSGNTSATGRAERTGMAFGRGYRRMRSVWRHWWWARVVRVLAFVGVGSSRLWGLALGCMGWRWVVGVAVGHTGWCSGVRVGVRVVGVAVGL